MPKQSFQVTDYFLLFSTFKSALYGSFGFIFSLKKHLGFDLSTFLCVCPICDFNHIKLRIFLMEKLVLEKSSCTRC